MSQLNSSNLKQTVQTNNVNKKDY